MKQNGTKISSSAEDIADKYNAKIVFKPGKSNKTWFLFNQSRREHQCDFILFLDDPRICYSIREQICVGVWPKPKGFESKGYAKNLQIKSRCIDASKCDGCVF